MKIKNWPYWLKGGIIGFIFFLMLIVIAQLVIRFLGLILPYDMRAISFSEAYPVLFYIRIYILKFVFASDFLGFLFCKGICHGEEVIVQIITMPIAYTIYGTIIGIIYGSHKKQ